MMATLADVIATARLTLVAAGIPPGDAQFDAELLARHVLHWDRARLAAEMRSAAPPGFDSRYDTSIARRAAREPASQIVGIREFWGLEFEVTPDVLTPRPETELIVEEALELATAHTPRIVIDVGTGSGCLAIALAAALPETRVIATDISDRALVVARRNADRHGVQDRIDFRRTDLLANVDAVADLIVSNPPYVSSLDRARLPPEVVDHEPDEALFAGPDGLAVVGRLLIDARARLTPAGRMIVELGYDQHDTFARLASGHGWEILRFRRDLQEVPRTAVLGRLP